MLLRCFALRYKLKWDFGAEQLFLQRLPSGNKYCVKTVKFRVRKFMSDHLNISKDDTRAAYSVIALQRRAHCQNGFNDPLAPLDHAFPIGCNEACQLRTLIARFMGPTWGPSGTDRTKMGPCWPHEPCYLGIYFECLNDRYNRAMGMLLRVNVWSEHRTI